MPDPDLNVYEDVNMDINTVLPESIAPKINSPRDHEWSYFNPSARPMPHTDVVIHLFYFVFFGLSSFFLFLTDCCFVIFFFT